MWDSIIVPIVQYAKEKKYKINYGLTSNCTLLTKDKVDFLIDNNIGLLMSIDGDRNTQENNRPCKNSQLSSFDLIMENFPYIKQHFPFNTFRATITKDTCHNLYHDIMFAGDLGFSETFFIINEFEEWDQEHRAIVEQEIRKYTLYLINQCMNEHPFIKLRPLEQAFNKIISIDDHLIETDGDDESFGPPEENRCGMGSGYGSVNYRGEIFSCQEVASRAGEKDIFYIGNIHDGIDENRINKLRNAFLNREVKFYNHDNPNKCANCLHRLACVGNICPINNYILYKDFSACPDCWCWWNCLLMEEAALIFHILGNNKNEFFKNYLMEEITSQGGPFNYGV